MAIFTIIYKLLVTLCIQLGMNREVNSALGGGTAVELPFAEVWNLLPRCALIQAAKRVPHAEPA